MCKPWFLFVCSFLLLEHVEVNSSEAYLRLVYKIMNTNITSEKFVELADLEESIMDGSLEFRCTSENLLPPENIPLPENAPQPNTSQSANGTPSALSPPGSHNPSSAPTLLPTDIPPKFYLGFAEVNFFKLENRSHKPDSKKERKPGISAPLFISSILYYLPEWADPKKKQTFDEEFRRSVNRVSTLMAYRRNQNTETAAVSKCLDGLPQVVDNIKVFMDKLNDGKSAKSVLRIPRTLTFDNRTEEVDILQKYGKFVLLHNGERDEIRLKLCADLKDFSIISQHEWWTCVEEIRVPEENGTEQLVLVPFSSSLSNPKTKYKFDNSSTATSTANFAVEAASRRTIIQSILDKRFCHQLPIMKYDNENTVKECEDTPAYNQFVENFLLVHPIFMNAKKVIEEIEKLLSQGVGTQVTTASDSASSRPNPDERMRNLVQFLSKWMVINSEVFFAAESTKQFLQELMNTIQQLNVMNGGWVTEVSLLQELLQKQAAYENAEKASRTKCEMSPCQSDPMSRPIRLTDTFFPLTIYYDPDTTLPKSGANLKKYTYKTDLLMSTSPLQITKKVATEFGFPCDDDNNKLTTDYCLVGVNISGLKTETFNDADIGFPHNLTTVGGNVFFLPKIFKSMNFCTIPNESSHKEKPVSVLTFLDHRKLFARCITEQDWSLLQKLPVDEILHPVMRSDDKKGKLFANLSTFIRRFNELTCWAATTICHEERLENRAQVLLWFRELAIEKREVRKEDIKKLKSAVDHTVPKFIECRNYFAYFAILCAMENGPVTLLRDTWELAWNKLQETQDLRKPNIPITPRTDTKETDSKNKDETIPDSNEEKTPQKFVLETLNFGAFFERNFAGYRSLATLATEAYIPLISVALKDLTAFADGKGNETLTDDGLVHFSTLNSIADIVRLVAVASKYKNYFSNPVAKESEHIYKLISDYTRALRCYDGDIINYQKVEQLEPKVKTPLAKFCGAVKKIISTKPKAVTAPSHDDTRKTGNGINVITGGKEIDSTHGVTSKSMSFTGFSNSLRRSLSTANIFT